MLLWTVRNMPRKNIRILLELIQNIIFGGENKQVIENIETACLLIQQDHNYFKEFVLENKAINIVTKKGFTFKLCNSVKR